MAKRPKIDLKSRLKAVLADELLEDVLSAMAVVGLVCEKRRLSAVLTELGRDFPLGDDFQFLKRVKVTKDGLCKVIVTFLDDGASLDEWLNNHATVAELFLDRDCFELAPVPSRAPQTRKQWVDIQSRLWPCKFHENKTLESILNQTAADLWGDGAFDRHLDRMEEALRVDGALLFDSSKETVLLTEPGRRPAAHRLDHVAMRLIASLAAAATAEGPSSGYLCTGLDVYLSCEPCLMCAMALVHARVGRVFFARRTAGGALASNAKLHTVRELNHLFEVYEFDITDCCSSK